MLSFPFPPRLDLAISFTRFENLDEIDKSQE